MIIDIESNKNYCLYTFHRRTKKAYSIADKRFSLFKFFIYYINALLK